MEPTDYSAKPVYAFLLYFLITYQIHEVNFNEALLKILDKKEKAEIFNIIQINKTLTLLEQNISDNKKQVLDAGEYYRLQRQNYKLLHVVISSFYSNNNLISPPFNYEPPSLFDLSAVAICLYANKHGLFGNAPIRIDLAEKTLALREKIKKKFVYVNRPIPAETFERFAKFYKTTAKTTYKSIQQKYSSYYSFFLSSKSYKYNIKYISLIANFFLLNIKENANDSFLKTRTVDFLNGVTLLHIACELNAPPIMVKDLLAKVHNINNHNNTFGWTSFHRACLFKASTQLIDLLCKNKADINLATKHGLTPLHITCYYGNDDLSLYLLQKGAKMNIQLFSTPIVEWKERYYYSGATALHLAIMSGCRKAVEFMIQKSNDFSQLTRAGVHVLHLACQYMDHQIVKQLCEKLTAKDIRDNENLSSADYAMVNPAQAEKKLILKILQTYNVKTSKTTEEMEKKLEARSVKAKLEAMGFPPDDNDNYTPSLGF